MTDQVKVACLLGDGFEDSEFRIPYDRMTKAGLKVEIIGATAGQQLRGKNGKEVAKVDLSIDEARADHYAALFLPGGHSPDQLRADARFVSFVKLFDTFNRPIAAICRGPQLLMSAGLVKGRTLTAWPTVQGDLRLAGANVKDEAVVIDRNWITSRKPDDLERFSEAIVRTLR